MPRKRRKKGVRFNVFSKLSDGLEEDTRHGILAVFFLVIALFLALSAFGFAGVAGDNTHSFFQKVLGAGYLLLPLSFVLLAISFFRSERPNIVLSNTIGGALFLLSGMGLVEITANAFELEGKGGYLGFGASYLLLKFFDVYVSVIILIAILAVSILIIFDIHPSQLVPKISLPKRNKKDTDVEDDDFAYDDNDDDYEEGEGEDDEEEYGDEEEEDEPEEAPKKKSFMDSLKGQKEEESTINYGNMYGEYDPPPISLLQKDKGRPDHGDIKASANIIKRTLLNFGIEVEVDEVSVGPSFTRYAIKPAEGIRLSRIVALQSDLALALAAQTVRIEAPIPGKALVGIEVPNTKKTTIGLASLISSGDFQNSSHALYMALGKGVSGSPLFSNLARAPHILIAGATGAGKSVTIHSLVTSLLYRNGPEMLRFIMVDPKRVELTLYNGIPHLLTPVITDPKAAILALKWAVKEMERRYSILETERVRDIATYHKDIYEPEMAKADRKELSEEERAQLPEAMPYIIIIIDELADIMSSYPKELEAGIVRLAQMSRAVGIHLVLSTQRPSVNVITGLIKANVPARIALQVSSQIDSRTILDSAGAEKLLGAGDMLYQSGEMSQPTRLQSAFISEKEVKDVVKYLKKQHSDDLEGSLNLDEELSGKDTNANGLSMSLSDDNEGPDDELYEDAKDLVVRTGKASTSYLQRKLGIGYARAARLIDILEEHGVVGPANGSKPREVYADNPDDNDYEEDDTNNENEDYDDEEVDEEYDDEEDDER